MNSMALPLLEVQLVTCVSFLVALIYQNISITFYNLNVSDYSKTTCLWIRRLKFELILRIKRFRLP